MYVGEFLIILAHITKIAQDQGLLDSVGKFHEPNADGWAKFAAAVEAQIVADGVVVPAKVDQLIKALPAILMLLGV